MTEQQYIENQMVEMLNKTYDKLIESSKSSVHSKEALEEAGTRQEYINNEMNKWREATLDENKEVLSAEEVIMIQNSDHAAQNVEYGAAPIPDGATDLMKKIQDNIGYYEISVTDAEVCLSKGHGRIFQFTLPTEAFKAMVKNFIDIGIESLLEDQKNNGKSYYFRVPTEK
jgi:hypothetical protein